MRLFPYTWTAPASVMSALALAACSSSSSNPPVTTVTPSTGCCDGSALRRGLSVAQQYKVAAIAARRFTHAQLWRAIDPVVASPGLTSRVVARSVEGREIRAVSFGRGPTTVLLWSQMHGDESTATMALADILRFLAEAKGDPLRERLAERLSITFVPMLNPDGAERWRRGNADGVDINRDGVRLGTPEARALKGLRDTLRPQFGFNLHDQGGRMRVGEGGLQTAIALLAPAMNPERSYNETRSRARLVAAAIARTLEGEIPGRVARYDDSFLPTAFGDLMQVWGTSTVLIESGELPEDPEKQRLRGLNVAGILAALDAIATGTLAGSDPDWYEALPFNHASRAGQ